RRWDRRGPSLAGFATSGWRRVRRRNGWRSFWERPPPQMNEGNDVARGFLDKLLGRSAPPPALADALAALQRLIAERPSLTQPAAVLSELLPILAEPSSNVSLPSIPTDHASAKLAGGVPLLRGEGVSFDAGPLRRRWAEVCAIVGRHQQGDAAGQL